MQELKRGSTEQGTAAARHRCYLFDRAAVLSRAKLAGSIYTVGGYSHTIDRYDRLETLAIDLYENTVSSDGKRQAYFDRQKGIYEVPKDFYNSYRTVPDANFPFQTAEMGNETKSGYPAKRTGTDVTPGRLFLFCGRRQRSGGLFPPRSSKLFPRCRFVKHM